MATPEGKGDNETMSYRNSAWAKNRVKASLYSDQYVFLYEGEAKPLDKIGKTALYEAIVDFFVKTPWAFYTMMSPETYQYLQDKADQKAEPVDEHSARCVQDDFKMLRDFFVLNEKGEINEDYLPLLGAMRREEQTKINAVLERFSLLKGLMDLYGFCDNASLLEKYKAATGIALTLNDLRSLAATALFGYYYKMGTKYTFSRELSDAKSRKAFLSVEKRFPEMPYENFAPEEILAFANRFYFPAWALTAQRVYQAYEDGSHPFSLERSPFEDSAKAEDLKADCATVNRSIPKWFLKGHTLQELAQTAIAEKKKIVRIDEKDIGPEIFFPFKDTIVGVYNLAKEQLHLAGDVATGDMPWDNLEKIKTEFYAHRESYIQAYVDSLGRTLTPYEKDTVEGLRLAIPSRFIFHALSREGAILIDTSDGKRYLVHPLGMGFSEMLEGGYYDEIVSTTIIPFEDYLTYDSFISGSALLISTSDPNALEEGRLIRSSKDFAALA
jgi:hypothetical protein